MANNIILTCAWQNANPTVTIRGLTLSWSPLWRWAQPSCDLTKLTWSLNRHWSELLKHKSDRSCPFCLILAMVSIASRGSKASGCAGQPSLLPGLLWQLLLLPPLPLQRRRLPPGPGSHCAVILSPGWHHLILELSVQSSLPQDSVSALPGPWGGTVPGMSPKRWITIASFLSFVSGADLTVSSVRQKECLFSVESPTQVAPIDAQ